MKRFTVYAGLVFALFTYQAHSANLYLLTFLEEAPLKGVVVALDGDDLGDTDARGSAKGDLVPGQHELVLTANAITYPIDFSSAPDEDVEISVTFTDDASEEPVVRMAKYGPDSEAAEGYLTGAITNIAGYPVVGATVNLVGTQYSASTDDSGVYLMSVPRGLYDIEVSYPDYRNIDVSGIRILADLGVTAGFKLFENDGSEISYDDSIEEVFVLGVFNPVEDSSSIERYATSITNAIDIAQLERFGDSDVASALNRVSGVAVTDSKYATVRGLDGRYVSSTLNGLLMPSTDPQRRDVQLDLFPTSILGGIEIQKSYTPDQLATTTGGAIKIETRGLPDEKIHKISGSFGYNTDFTGDDIVKYRGSNYDWLGVDSGLRDLPRDVVAATRGGSSLTICDPAIDPIRCTSELDAAQLGVQFQDDYNISTKEALPDVDASWVYGDRLSAGDSEWGYYLALSFDRETTDRGTAKLSNPLETVGSYMRSRETTALTGYVVVGYEFGEADEILSKTTVLRSSDDTTRQEQGIERREDNSISSAVLEWVEREFISQSFSGHHEFDFGAQPHQLDWRLAYSQTDRYEPDRRQYTYFNDSLSTSSFERRWSDLNENSTDIGFDYTLPLEWSNTVLTDFKAGVLWSDKDREVEQYRFGIRLGSLNDLDLGIDQDIERDILPYQNFALDRVRLSANTTDTDSYESQEEIKSYYITSNTDFGEQLSVLFGARFEDFSQQLDYPNQASASNSLDHDDWYPALNLTWRITDEIQLRAGYSETVSYPGLIERSESQSFDPETDDPIFGNPDLQVSTIDNLDLRAEYYFSEDESISLAIFTKQIDSPIERAIPDASGSAAGGITFVNQDSADLLGVELDANKNLIDHDEYMLFIGGNLSYIDSEVDLSEDSLRLEGVNADGRTLQGQSEWLANFQLGFDHYPTEQKFTLLVNYFDDRIFRISRGAATGAEFEDARVLIDFTYEKIFSDSFTLEASIKNLLNEKVEFSQNNSAIESYENGRAIGISLKYEFL
ncbi:MAG: outer membrane receptor for ferrienterochelin and colicin [Halioglobus sp.]|jgi:outer membrane receptor for ferrienterochelin and colicin